MTLPRINELRSAYPDWLVWQICDRWWAKHRSSTRSVRADDLDTLAKLIQAQTLPGAPKQGLTQASARSTGTSCPPSRDAWGSLSEPT
ncbi:hypothetical protein DQ384_38370 [Sphaerisporangium album]|uniref:Uncharacterized protein n=1 Tax=Sphaerisporangium album TaxID=509200 RepID=A0A367ELZ3_9ACTN|nr:hypothetical protein DQ384_38370 [Sphaerisporangium album]